MRVVMLGAPGAGKGTQSNYFAERFSIPHISSGTLFRRNIKEETDLGKRVKEIIDRGELVPDQIVIEMVMERILQRDCSRGYILDGFPRTYAQAKALRHSLLKFGEEIDYAVSLSVPDDIIRERMTTRIVCPVCDAQYNTRTNPPIITGICDKCGAPLTGRADDDEETVAKRLEIFHSETEPIRDYYRRKGILIEIDGTLHPYDVYKEIVKSLVHYGYNQN